MAEGDMDGSRLTSQIAELARTLQAEQDETEVLARVVAAAAREVPGAQYAGITVLSRSGAATPAASHPLVAEVDAVQYELGEGPCLQAATGPTPAANSASDSASDSGRLVRSDWLENDPRWPSFGFRAAGLGVQSMLSFRLFTHPTSTAALNMYAGDPGAFGVEGEQIGELLAAHAAMAMTTTNTEAQLHAAINTRDLIGQAKGILMQRHHITAEHAFDLLITASQNTNTKLHTIAEHLTHRGTLPHFDPDTVPGSAPDQQAGRHRLL